MKKIINTKKKNKMENPLLEMNKDSKNMDLAKEWLAYILKFEADNNKNREMKIKLPIETVDELPVKVLIKFGRAKCSSRHVNRVEGGNHIHSIVYTNLVILLVTSDKILCDNNYEYRNLYIKTLSYTQPQEQKDWTLDILQQSIVSIISILNSIKFNSYATRFDYDGYTNIKLLKDIFKGDNITHLDQSCCICHDDTQCKTKCGHNMCLRCWSKLKVEKRCDSCEDEDCECDFDEGHTILCEGHTCPICRNFMKILDE